MTTPLIPLGTTAVISANTSPVMGKINRYNASGANRTPTLPALSGLTPGAHVIVEKDALDASTNTVTVSRAGSDLFDDGSTSVILSTPGQKVQLQVVRPASTKLWKVVGGYNPSVALLNPTTAITYNGNGTVATLTENGITTTYTYNSDGTVHTDTRLGVTRTYTYDGSGNLTGIAS